MDAFKFVPDNALYIIETEEPVAGWQAFSKTEIWQLLKHHEVMEDLVEDANYLDTLISDNPKLFKWFDGNSLLISAHQTTAKDYDFLFVAGVSVKAKKSLLLPGIKNLLKASNYKTNDLIIEEADVLQATDNSGASLFIAHIDNQLVCSYSKLILTQSLKTITNSNSILERSDFHVSYKAVSSDGLCRLYLPYRPIKTLLNCYFDDELGDITNVTKQLRSSTFDFSTTSNNWQLNGFTAVDSTQSSYIRAFTNSGESANEVGTVLSNRAAWSISFNFKSFDAFRSNLESYLKESSDYAQYAKQVSQLEALLNISVKNDLTSWIGDEISVAQLRKNLVYNKKENAVILIKSSDVEHAKERLNFVAAQVKQRTPALFKQIEYRNYQIQYLEIKGLFKLFFGNKFNKITKPYYTILEDYVVFSNSPYTLIGLIEDYENGRCLSTTSSYQSYKEQHDKSSVHLFVSPTNLYPVLMPLLDNEAQKSISASKEYFEALESIGLTLTTNGQGFKTHVTLTKSNDNEVVETIAEDGFKDLYRFYASERDINSENFVLEWIEDGILQKAIPRLR